MTGETTDRLVGERRERADLSVIPPAIAREEVDSGGAVGAVAYPYRIYEMSVTVPRRFFGGRTEAYVVGVDRTRRLAVRADTVPDPETRPVEDVLVVPAELSPSAADEKAREAVFGWCLRRFSMGNAPEISIESVVEADKLFWLAERPDGDAIVDSVRGSEQPLVE
ncbi:hypothetical protein [Halalkalicoccus jeotgali]|uniref:Uncharacterized protein n=1 Tax=Halalkalicoccus jeotgali (strain DSM 18796 / CECT 7217 / JCM 14584 / KCTC 4019 / B3) TaxID=795797 RepID=D8J7V0_HALJB|nr:hypothetical protein [Halalkalicoccus jeotgali]ADJ16120.1 hypothetical protein HacjB3_13695 [Halalkalicoccus jeotgali B3]ELY37549.1 hypothetical protein C497_08908 [Halalkalicoccus jeotgali B3]